MEVAQSTRRKLMKRRDFAVQAQCVQFECSEESKNELKERTWLKRGSGKLGVCILTIFRLPAVVGLLCWTAN